MSAGWWAGALSAAAPAASAHLWQQAYPAKYAGHGPTPAAEHTNTQQPSGHMHALCHLHSPCTNSQASGCYDACCPLRLAARAQEVDHCFELHSQWHRLLPAATSLLPVGGSGGQPAARCHRRRGIAGSCRGRLAGPRFGLGLGCKNGGRRVMVDTQLARRGSGAADAAGATARRRLPRAHLSAPPWPAAPPAPAAPLPAPLWHSFAPS